MFFDNLFIDLNKHLLRYVGGYIVFLGLISIFVVVYLVCFYMWLRVLISRKVAIYSDGFNIIIIIIIIVFFFV